MVAPSSTRYVNGFSHGMSSLNTYMYEYDTTSHKLLSRCLSTSFRMLPDTPHRMSHGSTTASISQHLLRDNRLGTLPISQLQIENLSCWTSASISIISQANRQLRTQPLSKPQRSCISNGWFFSYSFLFVTAIRHSVYENTFHNRALYS